MTRPTSIAAAAVLLIVIAAMLRPRGDSDSDAVSATAPPGRGARLTALQKSSLVSAMPRRKAKLEPAEAEAGQFDPYEEWDYSRILGEFMVPPMRIESADIGGVLRELRKTFAEHSGGRLLRIEARAAPSGEPGKGFAFDYAGGNLKQLLELVAAIGGYEVMIGEGEVTLVGREPNTSNAVVSNVYRVPPDFGIFYSKAQDPFAAPPVRTNEPRAAIEAFGIEVSEDVEFEFDPATATCAVSGPAGEVERIERLIRAGVQVASQEQIHLVHKLVTVRDGGSIEPGTFAAGGADFQDTLGELIADLDATITQSPSVVTRSGQRAMIEVSREVVYPTGQDEAGQPADFEVRNVGLTIPVTPVAAGIGQIQLQGATELTGVAGQSLDDIVSGSREISDSHSSFDEEISADSFKLHATDFEGHIGDGNTTIILVAQEGGTSVYHILFAQRIDPSGQAINPR